MGGGSNGVQYATGVKFSFKILGNYWKGNCAVSHEAGDNTFADKGFSSAFLKYLLDKVWAAFQWLNFFLCDLSLDSQAALRCLIS